MGPDLSHPTSDFIVVLVIFAIALRSRSRFCTGLSGRLSLAWRISISPFTLESFTSVPPPPSLAVQTMAHKLVACHWQAEFVRDIS